MSKTKTPILWLGLLSAFSLLTFDLYQPSLHFITEYFGTTPNMSQLTLSIYLFLFGGVQLIWGPLVDHFGRRQLLPGCLILALAGSIICAFAPDITVLIIGRALQGFALCCPSLIAFSASRDFEDPVERAKVISYISMIVAVSPILAPVAGAVIFNYLGWQANFLLMAIIALILLLQTNRSLVESPFWHPPKNTFSLNEIIHSYKEILPIPILWCGSFMMMFSFTAVMLTIINASYLIVNVLGYSSLGFGVIFVFNGLNIIVGNYLGIWLRKHFKMTSTIYLGSMLIIFGGLAMFLSMTLYGFSLFALSFALIANLGISVSAAPTMSLTLSDFKENSGLATALISTIRLIGSSLLSMLTGYLLMQNLNALPLGLIGCGLGALYFSWQFSRINSVSEEARLSPAQISS